MNVVVIHRSEKEVEECDYRNAMEIEVDNITVFRAYDGEPEDSNLGRDFNDCYDVPKLMKMAYEAGKRGEAFNLTSIDSDAV